MLDQLGLVPPLLWELAAIKGNRLEPTLTALEYLGPDPSFPLAMAGLLHDIGEARLADGIALRLKLSNSERERIVWLIENQHALDAVREMRLCRLKQLLVMPGIHELLALYRADALVKGRSVEPVEFCEERLRTWTVEDLDPPPLLTGEDLIGMGLKPGPRFKEILSDVRDAQLDGTIHTKDEALAIAQRQ